MFKKWFGFAGCKPSKQNPSPFTVSSRTLRWRAKKWFYKSLNGSRIIHRWIPKIGDDDVVFEMKIQDELIVLLPAANRKWCGVKIGVTGGSEPANNYASQEDYLGYRRRQREFGRMLGSHTKPRDEFRVSGVEVWLSIQLLSFSLPP